MRGLSVGAVIAALALTGSMVSAQAPAAGGGQGRAGGAPPAPLTNLQVLPKDMPRAQVIQIMQQFEAALQVDCGHCHVWTGAGLPTNDYAADVKAPKKVAREMLKMVTAANGIVGPAVQANLNRPGMQVTCAMCHRGKSTPVVDTYPIPGAAPRAGGPGAAPAGGAPTPGR